MVENINLCSQSEPYELRSSYGPSKNIVARRRITRRVKYSVQSRAGGTAVHFIRRNLNSLMISLRSPLMVNIWSYLPFVFMAAVSPCGGLRTSPPTNTHKVGLALSGSLWLLVVVGRAYPPRIQWGVHPVGQACQRTHVPVVYCLGK